MPDYVKLARQYARAAGVPEAIFLAQINQESHFNPNAQSPAGAQGIAQIVPKWHPGVDPMNPAAALAYAAKWDAQNFKKYGNWNDTLSVYNSGRPWAKGQSFGETRNYVSTILSHAKDWGGSKTPVGRMTAVAQAQQQVAPQPQAQPDMAGMRRQALLTSLIGQQNAYLGHETYTGPSAQQLLAALSASVPKAAPQTAPSAPLAPGAPQRANGAATQAAGFTPSKGVQWIGSYEHVNSGFMSKVQQAAQAVGATQVRINSGYRSPEHNKEVGGAPHSNHVLGHALDGEAFIPGKGWVPLGTALLPVVGKYGLRSGSTFNWGGKPDVVHVDDATNQR